MRLEEQSINIRQIADRRIFKRLKVKKFAFALLRKEPASPIVIKNKSMGEIGLAVYRSKPSQLGQIKDISMDGLSFRYVDNRQDTDDSSTLDILLAHSGFYMENIIFDTISDFEIADEVPFNTIRMRQKGIQFKNLSSRQRNQLKEFIRSFTVGEVKFRSFTM